MFVRLFLGAFAPGVDQWRVIVWAAAAATMIFGNVAALTQDNVKRMLAYSSIAHAGYALMGIVAANAMGAWALLLYMAVYAFMNLRLRFRDPAQSKGYAGEVIGDYAGLSRCHPGAALGMLTFTPWRLPASRRPPGSWASSTSSRRRWRADTWC